jgi:menaquinol-cytochrome c reductase cytochrome b/c subunit
MAFTFFLAFWTILTIIGSFFRGPGFNWVWPWVDGLFFEL